MNTNIVKVGIAVAILCAAGLIYFRMGKLKDEDSTTYWWCTKANKPFQLTGKENEEKVATGQLAPEKKPGEKAVVKRSASYVTMARSPYSNDWTGIPAAKCEKCGEIFPLDTTGKKKNICPKCHWDPGGMPDQPGDAGGSKSGD